MLGLNEMITMTQEKQPNSAVASSTILRIAASEALAYKGCLDHQEGHARIAYRMLEMNQETFLNTASWLVAVSKSGMIMHKAFCSCSGSRTPFYMVNMLQLAHSVAQPCHFLFARCKLCVKYACHQLLTFELTALPLKLTL